MASTSTWLARSHSEFPHATAVPVPHGGRAPQRAGLMTRFVRALIESRQREAERLVAELIERRGARLTDGVEREIEARSLRS